MNHKLSLFKGVSQIRARFAGRQLRLGEFFDAVGVTDASLCVYPEDSYLRVALHSVQDLSPRVTSPRSMTGAGLDSQSLQEFRKLRDGADTTVQQLGEQMEGLVDLHQELFAFQKNVNRNFRSTIKEISRIQQALHLDYVVASESESDHEGEIGPVRVGRRESQGAGAPAPVPAKTAPCVSVALAVTASE
ncbi:hypothetical protein AK812_SmicGene43770, partial [Symbiodinium microadriaticum]